PTVGSTTISNSVVITSMQASIARLAMPRSARGTMLLKLRLQSNPTAAGFAHHASATANLTMPLLYIFVTLTFSYIGEKEPCSPCYPCSAVSGSFWRCNLLNLITCLCVDHIGTISVIW